MQCPANCINCPKCKIDRKLDVLVYSVSVCSSSSSSSKGKIQKILNDNDNDNGEVVGDGRLPA